MGAWTSDELGKIGAAEELQIAPVRRDGTPRNPVTAWVVRRVEERREVTAAFTGGALALLVLGASLAVAWFNRFP